MKREPSQLAIYTNCKNSGNFNSYFETLSSTDLELVYSSDFNIIINHVFNHLNPLTSHVLPAFEIMKNLRNKETHFYIDENSYLSFEEFKELCKLMKDLQTFFIVNGILERVDKKTSITNVKYQGYFDEKNIRASSYKTLVEQSKTNIFLLKQFPEFETKKTVEESGIPRGWWYYVSDINDYYSMAHEVYEHHGTEDGDLICMDFLMNLNEFYRRFLLFVNYKLICIDKYFTEDRSREFVCICQSKKVTTKLKR